MKIVNEIHSSKVLPIYRQIVSHFEDSIYSGKLAPGAHIPATLDLAKQFGVGRNAVQQALSILSERGLVERYSKRGTFVSGRVNSRTIGVLFPNSIAIDEQFHYLRIFCNEIIKQAREKSWNIATYYPLSLDEDSRKQYASELRKDINSGKLKGILSHDNTPEIRKLLAEESTVPYVITGDFETEKIIADSMEYMGITYLLKLGHRNIAVIAHSEYGSPSKYDLECLKKAYSEQNLPFTAKCFYEICSNERDGVAVIDKIIRTSRKLPDALLVLNDEACRGVIFGLMHRGIKIPEDISILSHSNKGYDILSPVPLTKLEIDPALHAKTALEHIWAKLEGRSPEKISVVAALIPGKSCGEK
ncbi:MAG: LacI family DNA-binding transcriptional regulator [Victivallales bacterium]|jgi:DNA-binding LacI/PurR family transcriptional regulator